MERFRTCNYVLPVVERMGLIRQILNNDISAAANLMELFINLSDEHLQEVMGILLQFFAPDRNILTTALEASVVGADIAPPAHDQIGFLRDPNHLWTNPSTTSRLNIWFYFLFRWAVMYFESTTNLLVKSVSVSFPGMLPDECQRLLLLSIATYHPRLLNLLVPYVRCILNNPLYVRDATEYSEVLLLTRYIFASNEIADRHSFPFEQLFQWGAGLNPNIQSVSLRTDALNTIAAVEVVVLERWVRACTSPSLITSLCRILTELPPEIHYIAVLAFSFADLMIDIEWDNGRPHLYERAIHVLLSTSGSSALYSFVASHLFSRLSLAHPRVNYIESCFHAFTQALQISRSDSILRHRIEENLRTSVMTNGNREVFIGLVNINEDQANEWKTLFPGITWKGPTGPPAPIDTLTAQPMVRAWRFSALDTAVVSLETIVRHVSANGFRNPFTNILFTWEDVVNS
jgi:hypothetical protein